LRCWTPIGQRQYLLCLWGKWFVCFRCAFIVKCRGNIGLICLVERYCNAGLILRKYCVHGRPICVIGGRDFWLDLQQHCQWTSRVNNVNDPRSLKEIVRALNTAEGRLIFPPIDNQRLRNIVLIVDIILTGPAVYIAEHMNHFGHALGGPHVTAPVVWNCLPSNWCRTTVGRWAMKQSVPRNLVHQITQGKFS
jgi:hypothetical protein